MHSLVTGGAGFIGSNLVDALLGEDPQARVTVLDKLTYAGSLENLRAWGPDRLRFVQGDVADLELVQGLLEGVDVIFHLAAETHVDRSVVGAEPFLQTNTVGTYRMLEAARLAGTPRFLQVSTDEVYGSIDQGSHTENDPLKPSNPYSASKAGGDMLCLAHHTTHGVPVLITRCTNNYGPRQYPEKLLPFFLARAEAGEPLPIYGDGQQVRDWLYVEDHCRALVFLARHGQPGEIYNISAQGEKTNLEVTLTLLERLGLSRELIRRVTDRPGHDRRYSLDSSKLRQLGWAPRVDFETGLDRTIAWYQANRDWLERIRLDSAEYRKFSEQYYRERLSSSTAFFPR